VASASTFALLLRVFLSLGVVLGLMFGIATVLKRRGFAGLAPAGGRRSPLGAQVEVLARKPLGRNATIAIVRAGNKSMVLGVTDSTVTLLGDVELDEDEFEIDEMEAPGTGLLRAASGATKPWKTMLEGMRDRTVRSR
jgi:flagellar biogenesis protein FliO